MLVALNKETIDLHRQELKTGGVIIYDEEQTKVKAEGAGYFNVPLVRLAEETVQNKLMANTVAVGAALGLAGYDFNLLSAVLEKEFARHGEKTVKDNITAARAGYDFSREHGKGVIVSRNPPRSGKKAQDALNGNEALCLGAMAAGCKFVAGYPMTPSSPILEYMADKGRQYGVVMMHVEDEIVRHEHGRRGGLYRASGPW